MSRPHARQLAPPEFLQLAGHPLRWLLLGELARSDRAVHELTALVDEPQNLVSYHLGKLRDAALVSARRSDADGRDTYYTVDLARVAGVLSATGTALHPGLRLARPAFEGDRRADVDVLFLCSGNSARSPMAEALLTSLSGGTIKAYSAGSHPKPLHPNAVRVMREEHGIDLTGHRPTHLDVFTQKHFDWIITLCDRVREVCPEFPAHPETIHWSIPNPAEGDVDGKTSYARFQQTASELKTRIEFLLAVVGDGTSAPQPRRRTRARTS